MQQIIARGPRHRLSSNSKMAYSGEINFDGLIGPTHNYAGLSQGNLASQKHLNQTSNPQAAALQGLDKMRLIMEQGIPQGFLLAS